MTRTLGKYRIEGLLARGGMAEVYRGSLAGPGGFLKAVCLKQVRAEYARDPAFVEMFENEARLAATLQHPNVVQVFDFDREQETLFLAMELVEGVDLKTLIGHATGQGLRLPIGFALHVTAGLLAALGHAHRQVGPDGAPRPVVHRDVSPHNVLVSHDGVVKLTDFGIAKACGSGEETATGVIKGKLAYLAPEQASGGEVGPRTDLYGAGLVLFELVTGRRYLEPRPDQDPLARALCPEWRPLPELTDGLNGFLQRLLAPQPSDRFASAMEAGAALVALGIPLAGEVDAGSLVRSCLEHRTDDRQEPSRTATRASQSPPSASGTQRTPSPARSGPRASALGLGLALAAVAVAAFFGGRLTVPRSAVVAPVVPPPSAVEAPLAAAVAPLPVVVTGEPGSPPDAGAAPPAPAEGLLTDAMGSGSGVLEVRVRPWAAVTVDGVARGSGPVRRMVLPAGRHRVQLANDTVGLLESVEVEISPGKATTIRRDFERPVPAR